MSNLPQRRQDLNRLMIITCRQVYNPLALACYQMGRPQSILKRIELDVLKCFSDKFFLRACIFPHAKISKNQEFASLTVLHEVLPYTCYTMTLCIQKVFIATNICLCDNSHIFFDFGEQRYMSNLQLEVCIVSLHWHSAILCYTMMIPSLMLPMTRRRPFW